jgi:hypothetical protein
MTVFVVKRDSAYPQLRVNDHIVTNRSVSSKGNPPSLRFHPRTAADIISFWVHGSNIVNLHVEVAEDICCRWQKL